MRVLFQNRPNALTGWGGDTTQMLETKKKIESMGVCVDVVLEVCYDLKQYDLIHIFNMQQAGDYGIKQMRRATQIGIPIALSTIYWDMEVVQKNREKFLYSQAWWVRELAQINTAIPYVLSRIHAVGKRAFQHDVAYMKEMLAKADVLLPNSYSELEIIVQKFKQPSYRSKSIVVPNAISGRYFEINLSKDDIPKPINLDAYILQVGRIEFIKGQLNVIKAMMEFPEIPLVFVGRVSDVYYANECIRLGKKRGNTYFIEHIAQQELVAYYVHAQVHVLPSLRESPGLATLEAAACGVNCVVSIHCPIGEYFAEECFCCDPENLQELRQALLQAWVTPPQKNLQRRIQENFTWDKAAQATYKAYERILK